MLKRLRAILRADLPSREELQALETRLAVLEAEQHPARLMEWVELRERLSRYLSRIQTVEQRIKQHQDNPSDPKQDVIAAVLRTKFPQRNGE